MTTTTRTPNWTEPGFEHTAARLKALDVLIEVAESLENDPITSIDVQHDYSVRVQARRDVAVRLAENWDAGNPAATLVEPNNMHYRWQFDLDGTRVEIYAIVVGS